MANGVRNGNGAAVARFWDVLMKLSIIVIVALLGMVWKHDHSIGVIEATRFTKEDGKHLQEIIMNQLPPEWLKEDVREIKESQKADTKEIKTAIKELDTKLDKHMFNHNNGTGN